MLGKAELDMLLADRDRLNDSLQQIIDEQTDPWGVKVTTVEIKDVEIPAQMQKAMARQAEAERERRAKIINSEGEFQAAQKLYDAAEIVGANPAALQLRYLQTLIEIGGSASNTIVFPLPLDLLEPLVDAVAGRTGPPRAAAPADPPEPSEETTASGDELAEGATPPFQLGSPTADAPASPRGVPARPRSVGSDER